MKWRLYLSPYADNHLLYSGLIAFLIAVFGVGCTSRKSGGENSTARENRDTSTQPNTLTHKEQQAGWTLLFDGKTMNNWRKVYGDTFPSQAWVVKDGALTVQASNGRQGGGGGKFGSIVTKKSYANFEFQLDFKLTKGANSGIKYFVVENPDFFDGAPAGRGLGLEYQIIDDTRSDVSANTSTAALYDMIRPDSTRKQLNPLGEWNHVKIISKNRHVEHWLNGKKVLQYERGSDDFNALVEKSKFSPHKDFGLASEGHIELQDHGTRASFRNIKIKRF